MVRILPISALFKLNNNLEKDCIEYIERFR